jgi:hypothetical protein
VTASLPEERTTPVEKIEEDALVAGFAAAGTLRAVEIAAFVLIGLLVCPPLAVLVTVVVLPLLVIALVLALLAAVLTTPYLLVHHFRNPDSGHGALLKHRVRHAGRALADLAPHRIVTAAKRSPR